MIHSYRESAPKKIFGADSLYKYGREDLKTTQTHTVQGQHDYEHYRQCSCHKHSGMGFASDLPRVRQIGNKAKRYARWVMSTELVAKAWLYKRCKLWSFQRFASGKANREQSKKICPLGIFLLYLATATASSNFTDSNFETPSIPIVTP